MFHENTEKEERKASDPSSKLLVPSNSPKNRGVIRDIGEKFVDYTVTSTGSMTIPIAASTSHSGWSSFLAVLRYSVNDRSSEEIFAQTRELFFILKMRTNTSRY
jgi:hypothetical protein